MIGVGKGVQGMENVSVGNGGTVQVEPASGEIEIEIEGEVMMAHQWAQIPGRGGVIAGRPYFVGQC